MHIDLPPLLSKVICFLGTVFVSPVQDHEFHDVQLNICTTCGMVSSLLCCVQYYAFGHFYLKEPWRTWQHWDTSIALALLITSDIFYGLIIVYFRRRFKAAEPTPFETGITKPLTWRMLIVVWYSGIFLICWTTWRIFVAYMCMNDVS